METNGIEKECRVELLLLYIAVDVDIIRMAFLQKFMRPPEEATKSSGIVKRSVRTTITF